MANLSDPRRADATSCPVPGASAAAVRTIRRRRRGRPGGPRAGQAAAGAFLEVPDLRPGVVEQEEDDGRARRPSCWTLPVGGDPGLARRALVPGIEARTRPPAADQDPAVAGERRPRQPWPWDLHRSLRVPSTRAARPAAARSRGAGARYRPPGEKTRSGRPSGGRRPADRRRGTGPGRGHQAQPCRGRRDQPRREARRGRRRPPPGPLSRGRLPRSRMTTWPSSNPGASCGRRARRPGGGRALRRGSAGDPRRPCVEDPDRPFAAEARDPALTDTAAARDLVTAHVPGKPVPRTPGRRRERSQRKPRPSGSMETKWIPMGRRHDLEPPPPMRLPARAGQLEVAQVGAAPRPGRPR